MREPVVRKLSRREELGIESRRRIVDAAAALMGERGFAGTSIAAVSDRSGLPSGSIYWHFESKEALLAAAVEEGARRWFESLRAGDPASMTPAARLDAAATSLEKEPEFLRLLLLISLERREVDKTSLAAIRRVRKRALEAIQRLLTVLLGGSDRKRAEQMAREFAKLVLCVADGAFVAHHIDPRDTDIRGLFDLLRRALTALARERTDIAAPKRKR